MPKKVLLAKAKTSKNDEFYTQLTDIEKELKNYKDHFEGKTVFCNCDDPFESNFFRYFVLNFNSLGLKKLIATCFSGSPIAGQQISLYDVVGGDEENKRKPYKAIVTKVYDATGDGAIMMDDIAELFKNGENELSELEGNGDFRSEECKKLLKESDVVVTNPPFSLFREYVDQLMKYKKKFIIIGNMHAITYKEIFPLIKSNKIWTGFKSFGGGMNMIQPKSIFDETKTKSYSINENGEIIKNVMGVIWYTNLDIKKRHEELILVKRYNPDDYPSYDNYDAIEVSKVANIPCDYEGLMGVPITFLGKYNPKQFEIVGLAPERLTEDESSLQIKRYENALQHNKDGSIKGGNKVNDGPVIAWDSVPSKYPYYTSETAPNKYLQELFARILIRNKNPEKPRK